MSEAIRDTLLSLLILIAGITILIPALVIMLVVVILIVIADEHFTRKIKHIINGRSNKIRNAKREAKQR